MTALAIGALVAVSLRGDYWRRQSASLERDYQMLSDLLRDKDAQREEELQQAHCTAAGWQRRNAELREQNAALEVSLDAAAQQLERTRDTLKKSEEARSRTSSAAKALHERLDLMYTLLPGTLRMPRNDADALLAELPADLGGMKDTELFEICDKYINGGG